MMYPEHEKLKKIQPLSQAVGEFLDYLDGKGIFLAEFHEKPNADEEGYYNEDITACRTPNRQLIASFFNIDEYKLDMEKLDMLDQIRKQKGENK